MNASFSPFHFGPFLHALQRHAAHSRFCVGRGPGGGPGHGRGPGGGHFRGHGGGWGGSHRGRAGRIFGPGDLRLVVLQLTADAPRHGYELIKAIEDIFGGQYAPSPGAIYPTLTLLEEQEFLSSVGTEGGKRQYRITEAGLRHLEDNRATVDGVMARMHLAARAISGEAPPEAVIQAMGTLKHALLFRRGNWTPAEVERVARLIEAAAEEITGGDAPASERSGR